MVSQNIVQSQLSELSGYLKELEDVLQCPVVDIVKNNLKLHAVERLFQITVDTALHLNSHIISESGFNTPEDYHSTFIILGEQNIIPLDFARKIAPSVGLRNMVVHKYGEIDLKQMIEYIKNGISDYVDYVGHITLYLEKNKKTTIAHVE